MKNIFTFFIFIVFISVYSQNIRYVKSGGTGDGSSWASASGNLQQIMNNSSSGTQIWIASGTYQPLTGQSFQIKNGVSLYGGFPNTGNPVMADRNNILNETILKGNQYAVIEAMGFGGTISSSTIIDGFTIKDGSGVAGAGIRMYACDAVFKNLKITGNTSPQGMGAGINISYSNPTFIQALVVNNTSVKNPGSDGDAGGVYIMGGSPKFYNCVIANNHAQGYVGGMEIKQNTTCYFYNGIIYGNTALQNLPDSNANVNFMNSGLNTFHVANSILQGSGGSEYYMHASLWTGLYGTDLGENRDVNPMFNSDYSLNPNSPAINKGNVSLYTGVSVNNTDYFNNPRIVDAIDIGVTEFQQPWSSILYVKENGTGDGSSWQNASGDLQAMMNKQIPGRSVYVAQGTYISSTTEGFFRMREGVKVYGGFPSSGNPVFADRNPALYESILTKNSEGTVVGNYHPQNRRLSSATLLDGFVISKNNSNSNRVMGNHDMYSDAVYSGITYKNFNHAASISSFYSENQYVNCKFLNNVITFQAGADFNGVANSFSYANPTFTNCSFFNNTALSGAGVNLKVNSNALIESCHFKDNFTQSLINVVNSDFTLINSLIEGTTNNGNSVSWMVRTEDDPDFPVSGQIGIIDGCVFRNNAGYIDTYDSPGDVLSLSNSLFFGNAKALFRIGEGTTYVTNTTITKNHSPEYAGGLHTYGGNLYVRNTIMYGNTCAYGIWPEFKSVGSTAVTTFKNSILRESGGSGANWNTIPFGTWGTDLGGNLDINPQFLNANNDFRLSATSPAVNAGDNQFFSAGQTPDISSFTNDVGGNPRIYGGTIDIGAYEYYPDQLGTQEESLSSGIKIYPNPASEYIYVKADKSKVNIIEIYALNGALVKKSDKVYTDVTSLVAGIYILKATLENGETVTSKLIKK